MIRQTILNYYLENIEYHKVTGYEEIFNPGKWITSSSQIASDFAKYIEYLLNNVKENNLTLVRVSKLVHEFYYQCIAMHGILLDEECKKNMALKQLFFDTMYEINTLEDQYCNTSQLIIDLTLKLILQPQLVFDEYQILQTCNWEYLCITHLVKNSSLSDYLINCLNKNPDPILTEMIIDNLSFQKDLRLYDAIDNYLCHYLPVDDKNKMINIEIQCSVLRYIRHVDLKNKSLLLKDYEKYIFPENESAFIVTKEVINNGIDGLLALYISSDKLDIKFEIINCYELFKSSKFASLLLKALQDETKLENGYYPLRNEAFFKLQEELFSNLIEWFGDDILNVFENTILEDE